MEAGQGEGGERRRPLREGETRRTEMGGEGSAHFPDGLYRSALMRKRGPRRHSGPPVNSASENRSRRKRTEEETYGCGKDGGEVAEELMLAVMFVVTPMAVSFFDRPPPDFLPHLDVHGGRAPRKKIDVAVLENTESTSLEGVPKLIGPAGTQIWGRTGPVLDSEKHSGASTESPKDRGGRRKGPRSARPR